MHAYTFLKIIFVLTKATLQPPVCFKGMASKPCSELQFLSFLIPELQSCLTDKHLNPFLGNISDQQDSPLALLLCYCYFNDILIGVSSVCRVFPRSCLLNVQGTNQETNGLVLPSSPTRALITGSLSKSSIQAWLSVVAKDVPAGGRTGRGAFSYPSETPQCSERSRLGLMH